MQPRDVAEAASLLAEAERSRLPVDRLSRRFPAMSLSDGYAIQLRNVARRTEHGAQVRGHKIGLTSRVMQEQFGIDEPDYGHLLDDMLLPSESVVDVERFIAPRIEVELGFYLKSRLEGPGVTYDQAREAIDAGTVCLEIIDSRIGDWDIGLADTIADNGSSAAAVIGRERHLVDSFDPKGLLADLEVDGLVVETGSTADVLGDPVKVVAWLANTVATHQVALEPGHLIMTGSCTASVPVKAGMSVTGRMDALGLVTVEFC